MSESVIISMIAFGALIIVFLLVFIYKKYLLLKKNRLAKQEQAEQINKVRQEKYTYVLDSLKVLSQALVSGQVGVVEGSIRIKVLIDHLDPEFHSKKAYKVFSDIFNETEHIPILKAWKNLDKRTKRKYEAFMADIEEKRAAEAIEAAGVLNSELNRALH
ncbi:DUF2489 domain-containing protein [Neptunomonas japonica]|uniref:DUF2489 domain-containing protein n=1 Tax=Neptunomonas japonica TaxID=417574 RepID=UPI0004103BF1|nr:DUF2489 domain-containing protein [Neptunomonas japonica]